ncbi:MAG: hypothetical protein DRI69_05015 [Bacteroidetes bacterium]|nr:MAG: hypothetical protein DRI69_05015 [Bacteroidota bacterium]
MQLIVIYFCYISKFGFFMRVITFIFGFLLLASGVSFGQRTTQPSNDTIDQILVLNHYAEEDGFVLYLPLENCEDDTLDLVVFVHGFGALNPKVYGGWIEHLVSKGNAVLFPRYQMSIFTTSTSDFVPNTVAAIKGVYGLSAQYNYHLNMDYIDLIGHSYGGVIIGNIAATYRVHDIPTPRVAFLCEPGSGPLTGAVLDSYQAIDKDLMLIIIVGDEDHTVGQKLGVIVYETAVQTDHRMLFWQFADENGDERIEASHYEPYAFDSRFDVGIENFTIKRAEKVSMLNQVDYHGYWQIFDTHQERANNGNRMIEAELIEQLSNLGTWSDGTPVKAMELRLNGK